MTPLHKIYALCRRVHDRRLYAIHKLFSNYTMVHPMQYVTNLKLAQSRHLTPGAIVECGTWKGGMIAGIANLLGKDREYFLFDSFEGLPKADPIDGKEARKWQEDTASPNYYDNCTASEQDAILAMNLAGITEPKLIKGWFQDTLPRATFPNGIAILRMDADWYQSTIQILESLFPQINEDGIILIDDYYTWDGCSKAVHDYLSTHKRPERITSTRGVCHIAKLCAESR